MPRTQFIAMALAGTALAAVPANAGGLLGGGASNCLCQAAPRLSGSSSSTKATANGRGIRGARQPGMISGGPRGSRAINGNVTSSVNSALNLTVVRSIDRRSGHMGANTGLAGKVSNDTGGAVNLIGAGRSLSLAGKSSTRASPNKRVGLTVTGLGTNHAHGLAGKVASVSVLNKTGTTGRSVINVAAMNGSGGTSGKIVNVSALNKTGTTGRSLVNASVLNGGAGGTGRVANASVPNGRHGKGNGGLVLPNGVQIINGVPCGPDGKPLTGAAAAAVKAMIGGGRGTSGKVANLSVLNRTGTTGRAAVNVAALNGSGGTSGKVANVSVLNKRGTTGHSAVNVAALNGTGGKSGKVINVAVLNGASGKSSVGLPSIGLPSLGCKSGCSGGSKSGGGQGSQGGSGTGGGSSAGSGSQGGSGTSAGGGSTASPTPRERDMADRKDLWWPPQPQRQSSDGRLNDH